MDTKSLNEQIGGNHYKNLQQQPIEFIVKANLSFIQGNIVKYVTRYKDKNGKQDIEKCIHYANLAIDLEFPHHNCILPLAYSYCHVNKLGTLPSKIIMCCVQEDYLGVIRYCKALIKAEYSD